MSRWAPVGGRVVLLLFGVLRLQSGHDRCSFRQKDGPWAGGVQPGRGLQATPCCILGRSTPSLGYSNPTAHSCPAPITPKGVEREQNLPRDWGGVQERIEPLDNQE